MSTLSHTTGDATLAFLTEGYLFGQNRFDRWRTDAFRCRLAGRRVLMLRGTEAARFFYERERFTRQGAIPRSVVHSLQDEGSVQSLDAEAHRGRKQQFLEVLDVDGRSLLVRSFESAWDDATKHWQKASSISLLPAVSEVLTRAALRWAGIGASRNDIASRTSEFMAMIDGAGSVGPRNWRGRRLRRRTENWAAGLIERVRDAPPERATVLSEVAQWRDAAGDLLTRDVAAVELLNLLRPVVAIGRFIAFGALALHVHPQWRDHVIAEPTARMAFGAEVRRTAPFFPLMAGRARHPLSWHGTDIARGDHVVIDLFATNRHPDEWSDASRFDPGRFLHGGADTRRIVAQGAGDMVDGHRCPGEPSTAQLLESAVLQLARSDWTLLTRDLHTDLRRIPALPGSSDLNVLWVG